MHCALKLYYTLVKLFLFMTRLISYEKLPLWGHVVTGIYLLLFNTEKGNPQPAENHFELYCQIFLSLHFPLCKKNKLVVMRQYLLLLQYCCSLKTFLFQAFSGAWGWFRYRTTELSKRRGSALPGILWPYHSTAAGTTARHTRCPVQYRKRSRNVILIKKKAF